MSQPAEDSLFSAVRALGDRLGSSSRHSAEGEECPPLGLLVRSGAAGIDPGHLAGCRRCSAVLRALRPVDEGTALVVHRSDEMITFAGQEPGSAGAATLACRAGVVLRVDASEPTRIVEVQATAGVDEASDVVGLLLGRAAFEVASAGEDGLAPLRAGAVPIAAGWELGLAGRLAQLEWMQQTMPLALDAGMWAVDAAVIVDSIESLLPAGRVNEELRAALGAIEAMIGLGALVSDEAAYLGVAAAARLGAARFASTEDRWEAVGLAVAAAGESLPADVEIAFARELADLESDAVLELVEMGADVRARRYSVDWARDESHVLDPREETVLARIEQDGTLTVVAVALESLRPDQRRWAKVMRGTEDVATLELRPDARGRSFAGRAPVPVAADLSDVEIDVSDRPDRPSPSRGDRIRAAMRRSSFRALVCEQVPDWDLAAVHWGLAATRAEQLGEAPVAAAAAGRRDRARQAAAIDESPEVSYLAVAEAVRRFRGLADA